MKCPCCGKEMVMDAHTKIDKFMCYECGYVEGRMLPNSHTKKIITARVYTLLMMPFRSFQGDCATPHIDS